ncbi:hypothetical protein SAMN05421788_104205 [Filimonas lacunae]|uniref:Lipocalin-like domain-containing protein n=2 Tax=Filimonas lacunae TaxID=477680 RepID=A0A173M939_9BACT|nr:hypothetical protein FLA_0035 [Filimonas lacunae]SIT15917.1 hypothetical protein SAMN05421788_104205 [Filimonas lacunae]
MKVLSALAMVVLGSGLFFACSKNDEQPDTTPAVIVKLTKSNWKINSITRPKLGSPAGDSVISKACTSDDLIQVSIQGTYVFSDSTSKCDSTVFPYSKGSWKYDLTKDSLQLTTATTPAKNYKWKVLTLNDSVMKVQYIDSTVLTDKFTKTISFKH